jgi:type VI secretion system protein ImpG
MFPKYFQEELSNLRELGAEFSQKHPSLAPMLSGPQADPDVERLLEGTAFLTGLMRQKLDDEFPEVVQDLMQMVAPHYLKPLPSATIQVFRPKSTVRRSFKLPAGVMCASVPVDGVSCLFRTCYDVEVHPLTVADAAFLQRPGQPPAIKITFELNGLPLSQWKPESVRLYLGNEFSKAADLYLLLRRHLKSIRLIPSDGTRPCLLDRGCLRPVGFDLAERLVPSPSHAFPGFGALQDYFALPQKFLFLDLVGWERWSSRGAGGRFEVLFELEDIPSAPVGVSRESFVLHATPAVNLFQQEADPIFLDHQKTRYPIRPSGSDAEQARVFAVEEIKGFVQGTCEERTYEAFDLFRPATTAQPVFHLSQAPSPISSGVDSFLSVAYPPEGELPAPETLSVKLTCTNGSLPGRLRTGDVSIHGKGCPEYVTFMNVIPPTPGAPSPIGKNLLWRLLSHLSAGFQSLEREDVLKSMLELYIFPEARDPEALANRKRISGIQEVRARSGDRLVSGMVMRGREIRLKIQEDHFASRGDAFLFGSVLDTFFGNYASINSFTSLTIKDVHGGSISWPPRMGNRPLL